MTILQEPATAPPLTKCPDWCRLDPEHGWDSWDPETGRFIRGHAGPTPGSIFTGGQETSDRPGVVVLDAGVLEQATDDELTPFDLRELARDCMAAAEWMEAHQ